MAARDGIVIQDTWKRQGRLLPAPERSRPASRWRARVWDSDRRRYLGAGYHPTQTAATAAAKARQAELEVHQLDMDLAPSLRVIGPAYVESLQHRIGKPATRRHVAQVEEVIRRLREAGADDMRSPAFPGIVQRVVGGLEARRTWLKEGDWREASESTKRKYLVIARALCAFAQKRRLLVHNPLDILKLPAKAEVRRPVYPLADLRRLVGDGARWRDDGVRVRARAALAAVGGKRQAAAEALGIAPSTLHYQLRKDPVPDPWWPFVCLLIYTGARASEVQHLQWHHWDRRRNRIVIPSEHPGNKTRRERTIPIQPELFEVLGLHHGRDGHVTGERGGFILDEDVVTKTEAERALAFKAYCKRHGVRPVYWPIHALRRSAASMMTALGLSPHVVMDWAGHVTSDVSRDYSAGHDEYRDEVAKWPQGSSSIPDFYLRRQHNLEPEPART